MALNIIHSVRLENVLTMTKLIDAQNVLKGIVCRAKLLRICAEEMDCL